MTILRIVFLLAIIATNLKAQNLSQPQSETIESLIQSLEGTNIDSIKRNALIKLAGIYSPTDKEKSIVYYQQALEYEMGKQKKARTFSNIGINYWSLGNFNKAIKFHHQSLSLYNSLQDSTQIGRIINNIAAANWSVGKWNDALEYYQKALIFRKATNDFTGESNTLNNIGLVYQDFGIYDEALNYHNKALKIALHINKPTTISYSYANIGLCYMLKDEFESALKYHKLGFEVYSNGENSKRNNSYYLANIGVVYSKLGNTDSALYYANRSLEQAIFIKNNHRIAIAENILGNNYLQLGQMNTAANYLRSSYLAALENNYKDLLRDNQFALAEIEETKGNLKQSLAYYKHATAIEDSLFNKKEIAKFTQITIRQIKEKEANEKALLNENIQIQKLKIRKEKVIRWIIISGCLLLIIALIYITRSRKSIQKLNLQLINSEKELKQANADKIKFFSIISHDLRSPFTSIMGLTHLLTLDVKAKQFADIETYAHKIHSSSQKAMNLLSNLMEWALSQTGRMTFIPKKDDINEIIRENIFLFSDIADQKTIRIANNTEGILLVKADKSMVNTILRNLISNAIKFTESGGKVEITSEIRNSKVEIAVSDNGVGLASTSIEKLFRIDTQFTTTGTQEEEGTGLGLMLCKEFIEKHSEKIWVISELGKGSTFYFSLPLHLS